MIPESGKVQRGRPKKTTATTANESDQNESARTENTRSLDSEVKERKPRQPRQNADEALETIRGALTLALSGVGATVMAVNMVDGMAIAQGTPKLVDSIIMLAKQDKAVRLYLLRIATQSAYLNVIGSVVAILIPIMANHKLLPPIFAAPFALPQDTNGFAPLGN